MIKLEVKNEDYLKKALEQCNDKIHDCVSEFIKEIIDGMVENEYPKNIIPDCGVKFDMKGIKPQTAHGLLDGFFNVLINSTNSKLDIKVVKMIGGGYMLEIEESKH